MIDPVQYENAALSADACIYFQWLDPFNIDHPIRDFRPAYLRWADSAFVPAWMCLDISAAWVSPDFDFVAYKKKKESNPVAEIIEALKNAAIDPSKLGAFFCYNPTRKKAEWTRHPELISREMNLSDMFDFHVTPVQLVQAQKEMGVWEKRKHHEEWEYEIEAA